MINLPHRLEVVEITGRRGIAPETSFRFVASGARGQYEFHVTRNFIGGQLVQSRSLLDIPTTDADGETIPNLFEEGQTRNSSVNIAITANYGGAATTETIEVIAIKISDDIVRLQRKTDGYEIPSSDLSISFITASNLARDFPTLLGKSRGIIKCLTTQYTRSFDNSYSERYLAITNSPFAQDRRNLYCVALANQNSGFEQDIELAKVERLQHQSKLTKLTLLTYPNFSLDVGLDLDLMEFTDSTGNLIELEIPTVVAR